MLVNLKAVFLAHLCVLCLGSATELASATSSWKDLGYEFEPQTMQWYKFHSYGRKWTDAIRTCAVEGANLAVINSDLEAQVLEALFKKNKNDIQYTVYTSWVAIGIYRDLEGFWRTVDGPTVGEAGFAKWYKGQPLGIAETRYGFMSLNGELMSWTDDANIAFICEK